MPLARKTTPTDRPSVDELRGSGLFGGLEDELLELLASMLDIVEVEAGEVVYREGDRGRELFVVLSGALEALKRTRRGHQAKVGMFTAGEWFGEMALIDVMPRPLTVRAVTAARLIRMLPVDLDRLYRSSVKGYALFMMNVARQMSRRLRVVEGLLADTAVGVVDCSDDERS